jgi:MYXO-CTERM domain-containing protein
MKKLMALVLLMSFASAWAQSELGNTPDNRGGGSSCMGGLVYDDGSLENGYRVALNPNGVFVQQFLPGSFPFQIQQMCLAGTGISSGTNISGSIVIYADTGSGPGALLGTLPVTMAGGLTYPNYAFYSWDLTAQNFVVNGNFYAGLRWDGNQDFFVMADQSPSTPLHSGYRSDNGGTSWGTIQATHADYRAMSFQIVGGIPVDVPALGPWGLVGLVAVLMVGGLFLLRRRRALA